MGDVGYFEKEKEEEVVLGEPIAPAPVLPLDAVNETTGVVDCSSRGNNVRKMILK